MPLSDESRRSIFYVLGGFIAVLMIGVIGEVESSDIRHLTNFFLRIDGNNSPNNTIDWNLQNLTNVNFLNATTIYSRNLTTYELHYVNETHSNATYTNSLVVTGNALINGLLTIFLNQDALASLITLANVDNGTSASSVIPFYKDRKSVV